MSETSPAYSRPATPAAQALHLLRINQVMTRGELIEATGLSQPTITRAVAALLSAGLVTQRTDLTFSRGRGRPTVPLEVVKMPWLHAGVAVGTRQTYIAIFDAAGRTVRDTDIDTPMERLAPEDFIEHVMAGLNRLSVGMEGSLASVGVTFPGHVNEEGEVNAPSLGWEHVDMAGRLRYQFSVPVTVTAAVPAILGSEMQGAAIDFLAPAPTLLTLFADDSVGAAISREGITSQLGLAQADTEAFTTSALLGRAQEAGIQASTLKDLVAQPKAESLLHERAIGLGRLAASLISTYSPTTLVLAGSAFVDDPSAPRTFAQQVRSTHAVELRLIPSHRDVIKAIARAVAMDRVIRDPLSIASY